jgi:putative phage-type endonuclease
MITELLDVDVVIDRLFIANRGKEPYHLVTDIHKMVNLIFNRNVPKAYISERMMKLVSYQDQLNKLLSIPKVEQRSDEWYRIRKSLITASDFAQALGDGKFGNQKQFFQKKCGYEEEAFNNNSPPLKWGRMFEDVALEAYKVKNGVQCYLFGLIVHPNKPFFGASPDSISELGIMVEIKCPYKRQITGEVPLQYFYQIQGQLDVCKLDECDYLECEFLPYDNENDFIRFFKDNDNERGIVIEYNVEDGEKFDYSPFNMCHNMEGLLRWKEHVLMNAKMHITKIHYWQLYKYNQVRVRKDEPFLAEKFPQLEEVHGRIEVYKQDKDLYMTDVKTPEKPPRNIMEIDIATNPKTGNNGSVKSGFKDVKLAGYAFLEMED